MKTKYITKAYQSHRCESQTYNQSQSYQNRSYKSQSLYEYKSHCIPEVTSIILDKHTQGNQDVEKDQGSL